jgi:alpha-pyrone synthase
VTQAYLNRVGIAVPEHEVHDAFVRFAERTLRDKHSRMLFERMVSRSGIRQRWSCLEPVAAGSNDRLDVDGFYALGSFPSTAVRMQRYERDAPLLAAKAVERLDLGATAEQITHLVVATCTGLSAPGIDFEIMRRCYLRPSIALPGCSAR